MLVRVIRASPVCAALACFALSCFDARSGATLAPRPTAQAAPAAPSKSVLACGKATCRLRADVCCHATVGEEIVSYCAPTLTGLEHLEPELRPVSACTAVEHPPRAIAEAKFTVGYVAVACDDSEDCAPDEVCLVEPVSADATSARCMPRATPTGLFELCEGACRLRGTTCERTASARFPMLRRCRGARPVTCGGLTCSGDRPLCCVTDDKASCEPSGGCLSANGGSAWECTAAADCGEARTCCIGFTGSQCRTACDTAFELPACHSDADCSGSTFGHLSCKAVGGPTGASSCQPH